MRRIQFIVTIITMIIVPLFSQAQTAIVDTLISKAVVLREDGRWDAASDSLEKAIELAIKLKYERGKVNYWIEKSIHLAKSYKDIEAFEIIQRALEVALARSFKKETACCYVEIGNYYKNKEIDFSSAQNNYNKALSIRIALGDLAGIASVYNNMSSVFLKQLRIVDAQEAARKAISIYEILNTEKKNLIRAYNNYANILEETDIDSAIIYDLLTLKAIEGIEDKDTTTWIDATYGLGKRYLKKQEYKESKKYFQICLKLAEDESDILGQGMATEGLATIALASKEFENANDLFERAKNLYAEVEDSIGLAIVFYNMGEIYRANEKYKNATIAFDSAKQFLNNQIISGSTLGEQIDISKSENKQSYHKFLIRNFLFIVLIIALLFALIFFYRLSKSRAENIILREGILSEKERSILVQQALNTTNEELLKVREESVHSREEVQRLRDLHHLAITDHLNTILVHLKSNTIDLSELKHLVEESIDMLRAHHSDLPSEISLGAFTKRMHSKAKFNANMDVEFIDEIDDAFEYNIKGLVRKNLTVIVDLAFSNIRNHSQATKASLIFEVDSNSLLMEISDNGLGFDELMIREGARGISDIKNKAVEVNASCEIKTAPGMGTTIVIRVPSPFAF